MHKQSSHQKKGLSAITPINSNAGLLASQKRKTDTIGHDGRSVESAKRKCNDNLADHHLESYEEHTLGKHLNNREDAKVQLS